MFVKSASQIEAAASTDYALGGNKYCRVVLSVVAKRSDEIEIEAQGFQVDGNGALLTAPSGAASRTPGTRHTIAVSGVAAGTHTIKPGWVRIVGDYNAETFNPDAERVTAKPTGEAVIDTMVYDTVAGVGYRYDMGELERMRQGKCDEMLAILNQSDALAGIEIG